jgi:NAD(P)-dependent dehydrogenase (short-subunit alcohol dehydrogenase family)
MRERVCLVTGSTSGVGKAIATGIARLGATVVMLCRNREKGARVADEIRNLTGNDRIDIMMADLSIQSSIREFAGNFRNRYPRLHVLSNNAAAFPMRREETADGIEKIFATNYLSHFLLTHLLLDLLEASAPSRVITVSGSPGPLQRGRIDFDDIQLEQGFNPFRATLQAAFAKVVFSFELARRLAGSGVTSNTFHPGLVKSELARDFPWFLKPFIGIAEWLMSDECWTGVYLASSPEVETLTGHFFVKDRSFDFRYRHDEEDVQSRLWELSERLIR